MSKSSGNGGRSGGASGGAGKSGGRPGNGFPGGNWPSTTGKPSGGGRGNAPESKGK